MLKERKEMEFLSKIAELFTTQKYMDSVWKGLETTLIISVFAAIAVVTP